MTTLPRHLYPSRDVRDADFDGIVVLINLRDMTYLALDDAASRTWRELAEADGDVAALRSRRGPDGISGLEHFVEGCMRRGLLAEAAPEVPAPPEPIRPLVSGVSPPFLVLRAWLTMVDTWMRLRTDGLGPLYRRLLTSPPKVRRASSPDRLERAVAAFVLAENGFWFRHAPDDCLPRSLALFRFLRSVGVPAQHRIGGMRYPGLLMHAWVESGGEPVVDDRDLIRSLTVLATLT